MKKTSKFRLPRKLKKRLKRFIRQDMKFNYELNKGFMDTLLYDRECYHVSNTGEIKNVPTKY